jgi:hypothetical protein
MLGWSFSHETKFYEWEIFLVTLLMCVC